jgi:hypothetical protein
VQPIGPGDGRETTGSASSTQPEVGRLPDFSRTASIAILCATVALALLVVAGFVRDHVGCIYDDAFIYLRYARNLRDGCGVRFNCDDPPVEGFTSPLYLTLLWLGSFCSKTFVTVLEAESGLLLALTVALAIVESYLRTASTYLARILVAVAVAALLAGDHLALLNGVVGLETPLAALCVVGLLGALRRSRTGATTEVVVWALVASLARPECVLFLFALPLLPSMRARRPLALALAGLATIELARIAIFHDVVPNTYWCKSGGTWDHAKLGANYIVDCVRDFPPLALAPLALLARRERRDETRWFLGVSAAWLLFFLRSGGDFFEYGRLAFPLVPACVILTVEGLVAAGQRLRRPALSAAVPCLGALLLLAQAATRRIPEAHGFDNVRAWTNVGHALRERFPSARLATVSIGAMSFYSHAHVLDLVGLTSPAIARAGLTVPEGELRRGWIGHERHSLPVVAADRPDLIVMSLWRTDPYRSIDELDPKLPAEREIVDAIRRGELPYDVVDLELEPGVHWALLARRRQPRASANILDDSR